MRIFTGCVLFYLILVHAQAATMPEILHGDWCSQAPIKITPKGYHGVGDNAELNCDLKDIKVQGIVGREGSWKAVFSCSGEHPAVRTEALLVLQILNDRPHLAITSKVNQNAEKAGIGPPPLMMYSRC